mmetsp:Transcript_73748/g.210285  ORF Transcript_73748/g.210285 Transcript_73748/m.210285 type:complete len:318 (+) Transcript_73748:139-1092(+)
MASEGVVFDTAGEDRQFLRDLAVSTIALLVAYNAVIGAFPVLRLPENTKRCAWVLSIFSSCVCGPVCLPYVWRYVFQEWDETKMFQDDEVSRSLVTFFFAYLMVDTYYSVMHYSDQLAFLTGWGHHIFYMTLFYMALKYHFCIGTELHTRTHTSQRAERLHHLDFTPPSLDPLRHHDNFSFGDFDDSTLARASEPEVAQRPRIWGALLLDADIVPRLPARALVQYGGPATHPLADLRDRSGVACSLDVQVSRDSPHITHAHAPTLAFATSPYLQPPLGVHSWYIGYMKRLKNGKGKKEEGEGASEKKAGGQLFGSMD